MQKTVESIEQELRTAIEELQTLEAEQGHLDEAERAAVEADHKERIKAARSGKRIRDAITRRRSKVAEVRDRAEELPYELHAARTRVAQLRVELAEARVDGL